MRLPLAISIACLLAGAASAQTQKKVWTAAPVPGDLQQNVAPEDRDSGITGPNTSAPFSALPSGAQPGSAPNQTTRDGGPGTDRITPDLSK